MVHFTFMTHKSVHGSMLVLENVETQSTTHKYVHGSIPRLSHNLATVEPIVKDTNNPILIHK